MARKKKRADLRLEDEIVNIVKSRKFRQMFSAHKRVTVFIDESAKLHLHNHGLTVGGLLRMIRKIFKENRLNFTCTLDEVRRWENRGVEHNKFRGHYDFFSLEAKKELESFSRKKSLEIAMFLTGDWDLNCGVAHYIEGEKNGNGVIILGVQSKYIARYAVALAVTAVHELSHLYGIERHSSVPNTIMYHTGDSSPKFCGPIRRKLTKILNA